MAIYALLIGINRYQHPKIKSLYGCENDVNLMRETLQKRFNIPEDNIKQLLNAAATKDAIVDTFETHFSQAQKGDTVVFYFSGHGSQEPAAPEFLKIDPSLQLETLVCHDSEVNGVKQLANKELRFLISKLSKDLTQIVLIIDSCHSGHISRDTEDDETVVTRQVSLVVSPRPSQDFIFYADAQEKGWINYLNNFPSGKHILLSACRDTEESQEKQIDGERHGVFTYSLCKTLNSLHSSLSYYNLLGQVRPLTHKHNNSQTPQIESAQENNINQTFLGTEIQPLQIAVSYDDYSWRIDAGLVHGLNEGDQVAIFTTDTSDNHSPLAITNVSRADSGRSKLNETMLTELNKEASYIAKITHKNIQKLRFTIEADDIQKSSLREAIKTLHHNQSPSIFIEENNESPDYLITAKNKNYYISHASDSESHPLFKATKSAKDVLYWLEKLKRWQQKLDLNNRDIDENSVQLIIEDRDKQHTYIDENISLSYKEGAKKCDHNKDRCGVNISLEVRCNEQDMPRRPQYCALFLFDSTNAAIFSLLNNDEKLTPSSDNITPCRIYYDEGKTVCIYVDKSLLARGITQTTDYIKLIVSDERFDAKILAQSGLEPYSEKTTRSSEPQTLHNLLEQEMNYRNTRGDFNLSAPERIPRWFTKTIELKVSHLKSDP